MLLTTIGLIGKIMIEYNETYLDFEDVRIRPQFSFINSRRDVNIQSQLPDMLLDLPVVVPSMRSLVTERLIYNIEARGGVVVQPRQTTFDAQRIILNSSLDTAMETARWLVEKGSSGALCIEIANGYMKRLYRTVAQVRKEYPDLIIWAGTVATANGVEILSEAGANVVLVGIGVGKACITTDKTGVGMPMLGTILDCARVGTPIISAGGLRKPADFVKAIAAGADACMIGALLVGCTDIKNPNMYYGMASFEEKNSRENIEGTIIFTDERSVSSLDVTQELEEGLRSAMSYSNAENLNQFRSRVDLVRVSR